MLAEIPSRAVAPAKLLLSTTFAKTRMLSKRSTGLPGYCARSNNLFDLEDIIEYPCGGYSNKAEKRPERRQMLTVSKSVVLGAAFLAGVAIAANADPASTSAAGTVANSVSGSQSQGRGLAALPPSTATPVPNSVTQPQAPAGAFRSSGARSDKDSFYSKRGFGPHPISRQIQLPGAIGF